MIAVERSSSWDTAVRYIAIKAHIVVGYAKLEAREGGFKITKLWTSIEALKPLMDRIGEMLNG